MSAEKKENGQNRRSGLRIMGQLIGLVKPLLPIMFIAVFLVSSVIFVLSF